MKRAVIIAAVALLTSAAGQAQGGLLKKIKNKVNERIDKKTDQAIDKTLDKAEGKTAGNPEPVEAEDKNKKTETPALVSYAKYDFIPGEEIIYTNNFEGENSGELPVGWNSSGSDAVVTLNNLPGNWLKLSQNSMCLTDNTSEFSENYTIEFDLVIQHHFNGGILPMFTFGLIASGEYTTTGNDLMQNYTNTFATELRVQAGVQNDTHMHLQTHASRNRYLNTEIKQFHRLQNLYGQPIHIAMQVQKERLRIWFNEEKLYDLPKAIVAGTVMDQLYFNLKQSNYSNDQVGYYIGNLKFAKGIPDSRHKLVEEGKFSTTGILFDVNAATIKPESNGVLKDIAGVLKKYPAIRVKIIGHTDGDGSGEANLELSKKRAAAVKEFLMKELDVDASRLETDGRGEEEPVGDNSNKERKAQNRRVEFIKL